MSKEEAYRLALEREREAHKQSNKKHTDRVSMLEKEFRNRGMPLPVTVRSWIGRTCVQCGIPFVQEDDSPIDINGSAEGSHLTHQNCAGAMGIRVSTKRPLYDCAKCGRSIFEGDNHVVDGPLAYHPGCVPETLEYSERCDETSGTEWCRACGTVYVCMEEKPFPCPVCSLADANKLNWVAKEPVHGGTPHGHDNEIRPDSPQGVHPGHPPGPGYPYPRR